VQHTISAAFDRVRSRAVTRSPANCAIVRAGRAVDARSIERASERWLCGGAARWRKFRLKIALLLQRMVIVV
jgi:hypothetical protein